MRKGKQQQEKLFSSYSSPLDVHTAIMPELKKYAKESIEVRYFSVNAGKKEHIR